ncbi:hypothetical protein JRO89_XS15G0183900 [Xanthoceras sorbifolium]|uniref:Uncharacterized protein n=1 Tax=Xanthoceras sorbifolium TaxID=99658 RepID=A0ABQ8H2Y6_9ROSI|nr:hypothetical protein JRO89_XS15G0183900 [Xanthoceras sorbifolium]
MIETLQFDDHLQIRVSEKISNGRIIHNVDCDMYSNNSQSAGDALCCFMDEKKGHEVAFVQFSEGFKNVTKNEIYALAFNWDIATVPSGLVAASRHFITLSSPHFISFKALPCFHRILQSSIRDHSQSSDEDVSERYQEEILEFGSSSPMFTIITTLAGLNFFCFLGVVVKKLAMDAAGILRYFDTMALQILLCAVIVLINRPLYQGLFFRKDNGKMPSSLTLQSIAFALLASTCFVYLQ